MAINVSVQYNGGLLPDIMLLTQCYYHRGTRLNAMKRFCIICEGFNDWGGRGYDDFVPGEVTKTAPSGMRLHDTLHGRQACPKFIAFDQGVGPICPRQGLFPDVPSQNGDKYITSPPPPNR